MTKTDIVNQALSVLGEATSISDYDATEPNAITARIHYDRVRKSLLRSHPWNFATTRVAITVDATAPSFGWGYRYALPADCLLVKTYNGVQADLDDFDFEIESGWILSDSDVCKITYVVDEEDTTTFDALFIDVFVNRLAAALAMDITHSMQKKQLALDVATRLINEAEWTDATENRHSPNPYSLSEARRRHCENSGAGETTGAAGADGWNPIIIAEADGARIVLKVDDWEDGDGTKPDTGYIGAAGIVALAEDGVDVRGSATTGDQGEKGWSPVLAIESDSERRVVKIVDWQGGEGSKPSASLYVGSTGLEAAIGDGVNIRGGAGAGSGDVVGPGSSINEELVLFDSTTGKLIKGGSGETKATVAASIAITDLITISGAVDLDTLDTDNTANNAKVTNATHSGDATGDTALTIADGVVTPAKLADTAVTPGSYTAADITVDAQGRITSAANGSIASDLTPPGAVVPYGSSTIPSGWLACDGSAVSRATYSALFAIVGTTFGVGDGATTFNLPDLMGRTPAGKEASETRLTTAGCGINGGTLAATGGAETHTLVIAELPSHNHGYNVTDNGGGFVADAGGNDAAQAGGAGSTGSKGGGNAHNNVQPTIIMQFMIKT